MSKKSLFRKKRKSRMKKLSTTLMALSVVGIIAWIAKKGEPHIA